MATPRPIFPAAIADGDVRTAVNRAIPVKQVNLRILLMPPLQLVSMLLAHHRRSNWTMPSGVQAVQTRYPLA
jgi:hypothetical protein